MKEKILNLRKEGKTYKEICEILSCSKGTVAYHLGEGQKNKTLARSRKRRQSIIHRRVESFLTRKRKNTQENIRKFQKVQLDKGIRRVNKNIISTFNVDDVINKFGVTTNCYLSGKEINLIKDEDYSFDHIYPVCQGGDNSLDNLGITDSIVNKMKGGLTVQQMLDLMQKILEYNKYKVEIPVRL